MTRYAAAGSFIAWYTGPSDSIHQLRLALMRGLRADGRRRQPHMAHSWAEVHDFVKPYYPDRDELARHLFLAKEVFNSPAHESQVQEGRGWHSRTGRPRHGMKAS